MGSNAKQRMQKDQVFEVELLMQDLTHDQNKVIKIINIS